VEYEFIFAQEKVAVSSPAFLNRHVPEGTPLPIWIWSLTIVAKEGTHSGILADLQLGIDNLGHLVHEDEVGLSMVTLFEPKYLRNALLKTKEIGSGLVKNLLDIYLARLDFPYKSSERKDIRFASYLLCKDRKEQEKRVAAKRFGRDLMAANLMLWAAAEGLKRRIGQDLFG
jgi:hypothetical protein